MDRPTHSSPSLRAFVCLAVLVCLGSPSHTHAQPTNRSARALWSALLASGCDLRAHPMWTPVEARILRNTPFAMRGRVFQDASLTAFFEQDGDWYEPRTEAAGRPQPLPAAARRCVQKLRQHERRLRRRMPLPEALEARMTRDHALFETLQLWSQSPHNPYAHVRFGRDPDGTLKFMSLYSECADDPNPDPEFECGGYSVMCPTEGPCETVAAG